MKPPEHGSRIQSTINFTIHQARCFHVSNKNWVAIPLSALPNPMTLDSSNYTGNVAQNHIVTQ